MRLDSALLPQVAPELLRNCEVRDAVAVQMTYLAAADLERELAASSGACGNAWPRRDLIGDLRACRLRLAHVGSFLCDLLRAAVPHKVCEPVADALGLRQVHGALRRGRAA